MKLIYPFPPTQVPGSLTMSLNPQEGPIPHPLPPHTLISPRNRRPLTSQELQYNHKVLNEYAVYYNFRKQQGD